MSLGGTTAGGITMPLPGELGTSVATATRRGGSAGLPRGDTID